MGECVPILLLPIFLKLTEGTFLESLATVVANRLERISEIGPSSVVTYLLYDINKLYVEEEGKVTNSENIDRISTAKWGGMHKG
jgi:hypothetical protein